MDESEIHHSRQTATRTENPTLHVLTHRWVLNNENTWTREGSITYWDLLGETRGGTAGVGSWGGKTWGEIPEIDDGGMDAANHIPIYVPMQQSCMFFTYTAEPKVQ